MTRNRKAATPWMNPQDALAELALLDSNLPITPLKKRTSIKLDQAELEKATDMADIIFTAASLKNLLLEARGRRKISLRSVATKAGMAHTQLLGIENSDGNVQLVTLARIAEALDCQLKIAFVPNDKTPILETMIHR